METLRTAPRRGRATRSRRCFGAGACAIAPFDDQMINALLGLDGESAFLIYPAAVGKWG